MSDLIDRQAAIDEFEKELSAKYNKREMAIGFVGVKSILQGLPSAQPEQQWIPCKSTERPKDRDDIMVTVDDGYRRYTDTDEYIDGKFWYHDNENIVAWKPFDEPWRGEEQ